MKACPKQPRIGSQTADISFDMRAIVSFPMQANEEAASFQDSLAGQEQKLSQLAEKVASWRHLQALPRKKLRLRAHMV